MTAPLAFWKVWNHDLECPQGVLARRFVVENGTPRATGDEVRGSHLDIVSQYLRRLSGVWPVGFDGAMAWRFLLQRGVGPSDIVIAEIWFENLDAWLGLPVTIVAARYVAETEDELRSIERHLAYNCARSDIESNCAALGSGAAHAWFNTSNVLDDDHAFIAPALRYLELRGLLERDARDPALVRIKDEQC